MLGPYSCLQPPSIIYALNAKGLQLLYRSLLPCTYEFGQPPAEMHDTARLNNSTVYLLRNNQIENNLNRPYLPFMPPLVAVEQQQHIMYETL